MAFYHITHITRYTYASTVIDCTNQIMLYPLQDTQQEIHAHHLKITSDPVPEEFTDYFGNRVGVFSLIRPHNELVITSVIEASLHPVIAPDENINAADQWQELKQLEGIYPYVDFLQKEKFNAITELRQLIDSVVDKSKTPFINALALSELVYKNFSYQKGVTNVETKVDDILQLKAGVCQDFAHVLLLMLRMINIPARYVSGYICPKNHELRGEGATHAWVEAYIPFYGWLGLDPTNNCIASDKHLRLALGRSFSDCTPVKGTYKGSSEHTLEVSVTIENGETKPDKTSEPTPVFTYTTKQPGVTDNSYRRFLEMQQQQQ